MVFTGQEHDEKTGLIYFGARYYDPDLGRFITQDTYLGEVGTPPSLHRYLYAYSNPTVFVDLYGHSSKDVGEKGNKGIVDRISDWIGEKAGNWFTKKRGDYQAKYARRIAEATGEDPDQAETEERQEAREIGNVVAQRASAMSKPVVEGVAGYATGKAGEAVAEVGVVKKGLGKITQTIEDTTGALVTKVKNLFRERKAVENVVEDVNLTYRPGDILPDGKVAGHGPGAALRDGPEFSGAGSALNDLGTDADEAVFWSGIRNGDKTAAEWVAQNGGATLETTLTKRGIRLPPWDAKNPASVSAWRRASGEFASGASGGVRVLQKDAVRINSVWAEVEFPALKANSKVTSITAVNPETGEETLLWSR